MSNLLAPEDLSEKSSISIVVLLKINEHPSLERLSKGYFSLGLPYPEFFIKIERETLPTMIVDISI